MFQMFILRCISFVKPSTHPLVGPAAPFIRTFLLYSLLSAAGWSIVLYPYPRPPLWHAAATTTARLPPRDHQRQRRAALHLGAFAPPREPSPIVHPFLHHLQSCMLGRQPCACRPPWRWRCSTSCLVSNAARSQRLRNRLPAGSSLWCIAARFPSVRGHPFLT